MKINFVDFIKSAWNEKDASIWLISLRLIIGVEWLLFGIKKLIDTAFVSNMAGTLAYFNSGNPTMWYVNLTNSAFIPNAELMGWLVQLGEFFVGLALILGIFTNFSAIVSIFMSLNYYFASAWLGASTQSLNWIMAAIGFIILLSPGIKSLSVDWLLAEKFPKTKRLLIDWFGFIKEK
ncbi:MAG: DoxX family protein [Candidatus Heimdallarchaeota archaeon]|nr:DoxX family protein [Candidatus Heimdallarchaeota archaeon]MCK4954782.1 DoxX family protein [Candidatus Heimdallarchaeota archaeon]